METSFLHFHKSSDFQRYHTFELPTLSLRHKIFQLFFFFFSRDFRNIFSKVSQIIIYISLCKLIISQTYSSLRLLSSTTRFYFSLLIGFSHFILGLSKWLDSRVQQIPLQKQNFSKRDITYLRKWVYDIVPQNKSLQIGKWGKLSFL